MNLIQYSRGYVRIKVWGYSPERFMNLCSSHDILLWEIVPNKDSYCMNISIHGFLSLRPILKKTRTKVAILQRYGLPFFIKNLKKRTIFLLGIVGCLLFLIWMSTRLWTIDLVGNSTITRDEWMDYLTQVGIYYSMPKRKIDVEELEKKIRNQYDEVTWTSVKIQGTKLQIQMKENMLPLSIPSNQGIAQDIIATKAGVVREIITRQGIPQVVKGSEVAVGTLLVSGKIPILSEDGTISKYQYCRADADIYLACTYDYKDEIAWAHTEKEYTGRTKKQYYVEIGENRIILPHRKIAFQNYDCYTLQKRLKVLDHLYLPIVVGSKKIQEYVEISKRYTKEEAKQLAEKRLQQYIVELEEKGVQIIKKDVKIETGLKNENNIEEKAIQTTGKIYVIEKTGIEATIEASK
ncbi:MAG: sporulation protein YqfD [Lachnospiraceae bacterium]